MIVLMQRPPRADAPQWAGRRTLAAVDAVAWPIAWVLLLDRLPAAAPLMRPVIAVSVLCALFRLACAVLANHRYYFTTWRWAKFAALLLLVGVVLKLTLPS
jgi:hypothetical protein